ncbi:MAG TPA: type III polyketide synthase, partial [Thermoanaerobaculia bacterium]|nr:type III polyketide synthase [Thermoanaerobaculia bacterium]
MPRIESVGTALPKHVVTQAEARAACERLYAGDARVQRLLRVFDSGVETRHFAFPPEYYLARRSFEERNAGYVEQGTILAEAAARKCLDRAGV